ncbi:MAG: DUF4091 domain-containing protein [Verrucomicrobia bacterium]|nr:DUF4091 domain-containing protein [Verrucomicrobiota bacterium]
MALIALVFLAGSASGPTLAVRVWTITQTKHVLRSEPPGDALAVTVGAARNEWVSFHILLRADATTKILRVKAGDLSGPGGAVLCGADARLYRQHQLYLETGTTAGTGQNTEFKPDWFPDPLIPLQAPLPVKKLEDARFRAVPFDLPANETHGFWVDLFAPASAAPGEYRGSYRLDIEGGKTFEIPVSLTVWNFTLPATATLVTAFPSPVPESPPSVWNAVEEQCAVMLSEHRFNAKPPSELLSPVTATDGSFRIPSQQVLALQKFVDRYHVNALRTPLPSSVVKDPETQRDKLRAWLAAFDKAALELNRPNVVFYMSLKNEPNTLEDYRYVQTWGRAIRDAKSVVKTMVIEQTWTAPGQAGADSAWGDLYGAVDIWCPSFPLHRQDSAAKRQKLGETVWTYTALCQVGPRGPWHNKPTPWWQIDFPLLNYRAPAWMAWRCHMKGLLYWGMSYWRESDDPWVHAPFFTGRGKLQEGKKGIIFNGEGSLVYPAAAVGYKGIVPTIRLKALRDSIEDYEYLAILDRLGKSAEADKIVQAIAESFFTWDPNPAVWETARAKLAALIESADKNK